MKASNTVEVAKYATQAKIAAQSAFTWWVGHVLKKRDWIVAKMKSKHWSKTHKYGIKLPRTIKGALAIDEKTRTEHWRKAFEKELRIVFSALTFLNGGEQPPPGYTHCETQLVGYYVGLKTKMSISGKRGQVGSTKS